MKQIILECFGRSELIDLPLDQVKIRRSKLAIHPSTFLLLNGRPCPSMIILRPLDTLSMHGKILGAGLLFGGSKSQTTNVHRTNMQRSFANEMNKSVMSSISTNQSFSGRDMIVKGEGNKVNIKQVADVEASQFVSQMSKIADALKSTLTSQLEASVQEEKSAGDAATASGAGTPAGGTASATAGGLVSTSSSSVNTTNEVASYMNMTTAVSDKVQTDESIVQEFNMRDIIVEGKNNEVDLGQSAAIKKILDIVQQAEASRDIEDEVSNLTTVTMTMESSGYDAIKYAQIAGAITTIAFIVVFFGSGMGGGNPAEERKAYVEQSCGAQPSEECRREANSQHTSSKNTKMALKVFGIIIVIVIVVYVLYKFGKYIKDKLLP